MGKARGGSGKPGGPEKTGAAGDVASREAARVADRLHSAAIHVLRRVRVEDAKSGLTPPRLSALSVIVFRGPLTLGELAAAEQVRPPTVTRLVRDLEADGLARVHPDPEDRRVRRVEATERGRCLLHEGRRRRVERLARDVAALPSSERDALSRGVDVLEALLRD
ncbi:MAG TPA: MarR family transcriptional regulator [Longimicrobiales bacterium]|nr:MarR family transcriptional regulator [Longimicrobiales bacterium]